MANAAVVPVTNAVDQTPQTLRVSFKTHAGTKSVPARFVPSLTLTTGPGASTAFFAVPCKELLTDESAFQIALKTSGPAGALKLLSRAEVTVNDGRNGAAIFCGYLLQRQHTIKKGKLFDCMTGGIVDDRWLLTKFKIFGRLVWEITSEGSNYYFDSTAETIFNEHGFGNCMDTPFGPRFSAGHRFGHTGTYNAETFEEPRAGEATSKSRSWRDVDIARYYRDFFFPARPSDLPSAQVDLGILRVPHCLVFPKNAEKVFKSDRPIKDCDHTDMSLLDALQDLGKRAGTFDLYVEAIGDYKSQLGWRDMNPKAANARSIYLPDFTDTSLLDAMTRSDILKGGTITEDIAGRHDGVNLMGDPIAKENFCSTSPSGTGALIIEPAWGVADEQAFRLYCEGSGAGGRQHSAERFQGACLQHPKVFRNYRLSPYGWRTLWDNTKWSGTCNGGRHPKILPTQLTADNNGNNPSGFRPRPIIVEYKMSQDEYASFTGDPDNAGLSAWLPASKFDALTLSPDGTEIELEGLRQSNQTWYTLSNPDPGGDTWALYSNHMRARQIRLNLACESDWPVTGRLDGDPNLTWRYVDPDAPKFTLQLKSRRMAYVEWLRVPGSRPVGEGRMDIVRSIFDFGTNRAAANNELFTDRPGLALTPDATGRIMKHAAARLLETNRIELGGELVFKGLNISIVPGMNCRIEGDDNIEIVGVVKSVTLDSTTQETYANFGNNDTGTRSDGRNTSGAQSSGSGGASIPNIPTIPHIPPPPYNPEIPPPPPQQNKPYEPGTEPDYDAPKKTDAPAAVQQPAAAPPAQAQANEKAQRKADLHAEAKGKHDADKAAQRAGNSSINGKTDIMNAFLGAASSGSINGKTDIMNSFMDKTSSGTINGRKSLDQAFDTSKSDAYDRANYRSVASQHDYQIMDKGPNNRAPTEPQPDVAAAKKPVNAGGGAANAPGQDVPELPRAPTQPKHSNAVTASKEEIDAETFGLGH